MIEVWTDGSCLNDDRKKKPGGWAAVIRHQFKPVSTRWDTYELAGKSGDTTNNRMEVMAVIEGILKASQLQRFEEPIEVHSDSGYVVYAFQKKWVEGWLKRGLHRGMLLDRQNKPIANSDLWWVLIWLAKRYNVKFEKVAAHSGEEYNERAHELAISQMREAAGDNLSEPSNFVRARNRPLSETFISHRKKKIK